LEERGSVHLAAFSSRGTDRYVAYMRKGFLFSAGHPDETELAAAVAFGEDIGGRWLERDPEAMLTAPLLPVGNISLGSDRRPNWGRECTLCLYCEMICPEEAIATPVGWPPFDAFIAHNVRAAAGAHRSAGGVERHRPHYVPPRV